MAHLFLGSFNRAEIDESKMWKTARAKAILYRRLNTETDRPVFNHSTVYTEVHNPILSPPRIIIK